MLLGRNYFVFSCSACGLCALLGLVSSGDWRRVGEGMAGGRPHYHLSGPSVWIFFRVVAVFVGNECACLYFFPLVLLETKSALTKLVFCV